MKQIQIFSSGDLVLETTQTTTMVEKIIEIERDGKVPTVVYPIEYIVKEVAQPKQRFDRIVTDLSKLVGYGLRLDQFNTLDFFVALHNLGKDEAYIEIANLALSRKSK